MRHILIAITAGLVFPATAHAETVVTHYIVKTQEERKSTRWTLTEWLRIKERMKMMDLWLAMFSNPDKDQFRPELNLAYSMTRGKMTSTLGENTEEVDEISGTQAAAQLWLTNLVSASTGLRTLNIDLGVEGRLHSTDSFVPSDEALVVTDSATTFGNRITPGNLRIFGGNVQDTSLIFKYGRYEMNNGISAYRTDSPELVKNGLTAGGEMILYLFGGLGAEARYSVFGSDENYRGDESIKGSYLDYQGFLEISLLRLTFGRFTESWEGSSPVEGSETPNTIKSTYDGYVAGLKILF